MGCGGSKPEVASHENPPNLARPRPARPPGVPGARPPVAPVRDNLAAVVPVPRPTVPDDRVNSDHLERHFRYVSSKGNLPLRKAAHIASTAPQRDDERIPRRGFPKVYRNQEGPGDNPRQNVPDWQIRRRGGPAGEGDMTLEEIPAIAGDRPGPFALEYDFSRRPARLNELNPPHPNDLRGQQRRWIGPPNDPGPVRVLRNGDGQLAGAIYHPEGNLRGYEPMRIQPLDKNGRRDDARHADRILTGRTTWPQRDR